jgi:hypothetical protein
MDTTLDKKCMALVNHLYEIAEVPVEVRQKVNDEADGIVRDYLVNMVNDLYPKDGASEISIRRTLRGFSTGEFDDRYGLECSIQKSSIATEDCIWLGINNAKPEIMASDAIRLGIDNKGETVGWVPYEVPGEVLMHTRMHLSQENVRSLLPLLIKFAVTGEIE